jgi:hypothetical protein
MQVWQVGEDGYLVGAVTAEPDPLTPGAWLIPRGCVTVEPPAIPEGRRARWTGEGWVLEPAQPTRWRVLRSTLVQRLTDAEAEALEALVAALPAKARARWQAVRWIWSDDAEVLAAASTLGWTAERVAELLAPDPDPELSAIPVEAG